MTLFVRRISYKWTDKYTMFHFIQESFAGFPFFNEKDLGTLEERLKKIFIDNTGNDTLLQDHVYTDDDNIWLYVVDTEKQEAYAMNVKFEPTILLIRK